MKKINIQKKNFKKYISLTLMLSGINVFGMDSPKNLNATQNVAINSKEKFISELGEDLKEIVKLLVEMMKTPSYIETNDKIKNKFEDLLNEETKNKKNLFTIYNIEAILSEGFYEKIDKKEQDFPQKLNDENVMPYFYLINKIFWNVYSLTVMNTKNTLKKEQIKKELIVNLRDKYKSLTLEINLLKQILVIFKKCYTKILYHLIDSKYPHDFLKEYLDTLSDIELKEKITFPQHIEEEIEELKKTLQEERMKNERKEQDQKIENKKSNNKKQSVTEELLTRKNQILLETINTLEEKIKTLEKNLDNAQEKNARQETIIYNNKEEIEKNKQYLEKLVDAERKIQEVEEENELKQYIRQCEYQLLLKIYEEENEKLKKELEWQKEKNNENQEQLTVFKEENTKLKAELKSQKEKNDRNLEQYQKQLKELKEELEWTQKINNRNQKEYREQLKELEEENTELTKENTELKKELKWIEKTNDKNEKKLTYLETNNINYEETLKSQIEKQKEINLQNKVLSMILKIKNREYEELLKELNSQKEINDKNQKQLTVFKQELAEKNTEIAVFKQELERKNTEIERKKTEITVFQQELEKKNTEIARKNTEIVDYKRAIESLKLQVENQKHTIAKYRAS